MPKGIGRPYNKELRTIAKSPLYKGSGLAGEASKAMEYQRTKRSDNFDSDLKLHLGGQAGKTIRLKQK